MVEVTKNFDGYRYSNFMHKDRGGKLKIDPIWDWNLSFGNGASGNGPSPGIPTNGWLWAESGDPWVRGLLRDPNFNQRQIDRWGQLRTNILASSRVLARVDELAASLDEAQVRNFQRWPVLGVWIWPNWYVGESYQDEVNWMKAWIEGRLAWIDSQFLAAPMFSQSGGLIASGFQLTMTSGANSIYYTMDGTDPRRPGGSPSPYALLYSTNSPVRLSANARVFARSFGSALNWSAPAAATFWVSTPTLAITELMYHPPNTPANNP